MASVKSLGVHQPTGLRHAVDERILPDDANPSLYQWDIVPDSDGEDELLTTGHCVVWSRGGIFRKSFRFDAEQEPVIQALLAYFPASEDDRPTSDDPGDDGISQENVALSKALVVFLRTQAHIFFLSGASHIVHMPFEVESACAAPCGVIIQRKLRMDSLAPVSLKFPRVPPNSFVSSQISPVSVRNSLQPFSTAALGKPKTLPMRLSSTLENMWERPLETNDSNWPRLVCLTDPLLELGLVTAQVDKPAKAKSRRSSMRSPFLDPAEEIVHIETIGPVGHSRQPTGDEVVLAVTVNRDSSMYTVWQLAYVKNEDRFTHHSKKSKTAKPSRRRSSMQPGLASGATTPLHASVRESLGASLAVKKTRRSEKIDKSIEMALSLEPDKAGEVTRRQSRRVSSLLARGDLSASHERSVFEPSSSVAATAGRRVDSHGSQRARTSNSYAPMNASATFKEPLNSLLEIPVDDVLDELRLGGDFEGFHNMGLDDHNWDGLTREIALTKIHSVSMDNTNVRYSLSDTPARKQCKVFVVVGTPFAVDEQDRNYLLICIQDTVDKRLQLLTLHFQAKKKLDLAAQAGRRPPGQETQTTTVTWGQLRRAQNVVDSCKVVDGDQSAILILSEGDKGQRQLSVQSPWSGLTTITLPILFLDNPNTLAYSRSHVKKATDNRRSIGTLVSGAQLSGLCNARTRGMVDIQDKDGKFHGIQIQLQPASVQVRMVLDICRSVLPAAHSEKMLASWWHIMQWLQSQEDIHEASEEWTSLVIQLFAIFLALNHSDLSSMQAAVANQSQYDFRPSSQGVGAWSHMQIYNAPNSSGCPPWMQSRGWQWLLDSAGEELADIENMQPKSDDFLSRHIAYSKRYMASSQGLHALGAAAYLPTAVGISNEKRRSAAWGIAVALHLLLEEQKLDIMLPENESPGPVDLRVILCEIARWLRWHEFVALYELGVQVGVSSRHDLEISLKPALPEPGNIPCVFQWVQSGLMGRNVEYFPSLAEVYAMTIQEPSKGTRSDGRWEALMPRTTMLRRFFQLLKPDGKYHETVAAMHACGFTPLVLDSLPEAVLAPLQDAISMCQARPPPTWSNDLLDLVNRSDMSMVLQRRSPTSANNASLLKPSHAATWDFRVLCETKDEMNNMAMDEVDGSERQTVVQALFKDDRRLHEAQNLLSSFKPRVVRLDSHPKWSESFYLEKQKELVATIATSTLAVPAGRGMLHYGFRFPLLTQKFSIHGFNLTCMVKPTNVAVGVDKSLFTEEKVNWAFFHQGVAHGLAISPQAKGIDTSWILYNKPGNDLNNRHAGFLLALGLNGHLKSVAKWVAFKYLTPKHTMTSIGLLLGLAASHIGTMDSLITRLLSVHVTRMLPRGAAELNLSHHTQTTGIMGIGLLYCNTQHRRMSEIMMSEIEFVGDEDEEDPLRNEGYRLAAGFALGYINLGKGNDLKGLHDMRLTEKLLTLASSTKKVELVNVLDRSAAGAVVAVALMFMKSEDHIVARKIDVPDAILQFDYVRPDILLLRTLAKNLILWSSIEPSFEWISASLPAEYQWRHKLRGIQRLRSRDLPFFSILGGLCFAIALRYAGSANIRVRDLLIHYLDGFIRIVRIPADKFDAQLARANARMCMDILALSCATVMAGTGDLVVFRRLRLLHGRDDTHTTYGSHLAAHMAIGALFLGCGIATFGTSNLAVASLLVAFHPIFPASVQDNRSHLQAFRHFWVLATDSRCLIARDMATGQPVSVPVMIHPHKDGAGEGGASAPATIRRQTPCLLPPLDDIARLRTDASAQGFWDLELDFARDPPALLRAFRASQTLYLRRRPPRDGAFAATVQALGRRGGGGDGEGEDAGGAGGDPLAWVFGVGGLAGLTHAERALVLDGEGGGSASSVVDARLVLEGAMGGASRDGLLGLRLLFEWADQRGLRGGKGRGAEEEVEGGGSEADGGGDGDGEGGSWWMRDSVVDMLKGKAWLAGQDE